MLRYPGWFCYVLYEYGLELWGLGSFLGLVARSLPTVVRFFAFFWYICSSLLDDRSMLNKSPILYVEAELCGGVRREKVSSST